MIILFSLSFFVLKNIAIFQYSYILAQALSHCFSIILTQCPLRSHLGGWETKASVQGTLQGLCTTYPAGTVFNPPFH